MFAPMENQTRCAKVSAEIIRDQQREIAQLKAALILAERQIERLLRGEFICTKCGLRKDGEHSGKADF